MKPIHLGQSYGTDTASTAMIHLLCESVSLFMLLHMANLSCSCRFRITFMVLCEFRLQLDCFVANSNCYRNNCFRKKFVSKQSAGIFSIFYYFILFLFCSSIVLYLAWNFVKISIVNDKDFVNETGTLTVYHSRDILKSDDYEYFPYDKVGVLYRRYLRNMKDETDY